MNQRGRAGRGVLVLLPSVSPQDQLPMRISPWHNHSLSLGGGQRYPSPTSVSVFVFPYYLPNKTNAGGGGAGVSGLRGSNSEFDSCRFRLLQQ